jgi:tetratricopeptide (TPR) repeat protein
MKKPAGKQLNVLLLIKTFTILSCIFTISCQSVQKDLLISSMDESARASIEELEETIVRLEAAPAANAIASARKKTGELEKESIPDADFQALLAAWSGRLCLLENKTADAQRELKKSQTLAPGNWPAVILEVRLERDRQKRLTIVDSALNLEDPAAPTSGELSLEKGRILLELNRFAEAVAAFDLAFSLLEGKPFYREIYQSARNRAWELRDIEAGNKSAALMQNEWITWKDLVEITKAETDLLRFLTAGRDWKAEEIFSRLLERSFIPSTQDINLTEWPQTKPRIGDDVFRSGAAWFLWHLYAENRANRGLLSRYSSRYANTPNARSPIQDLSLFSPFFDSILGCVESEFMSLPDGKNFNPGEKLRFSAYLAMLKKLVP